jgi:hypothetical protein
MASNRIAGCAVLLIAACMVCAVMWTQQDSDVVREDWTQLRQEQLEDTRTAMPETEFVESAAASEEHLVKEKPPAKKEKVHPADHDLGVWTGYTKIKDDAWNTLAPTDAEAVHTSCAKLRREGAEQCGAVYCAAQAECGEPCPEAYAQPQEQAIPLQPGGPRFHRIDEVDVKEVHNKELHKKETDAKEKAVKEHAEKAKEKAQKEGGYKERIGKEKTHKEIAMKEMEAHEHGAKGELQAEISSKESSVKTQVAELKQKSIQTCEKSADDGYSQCEKDRAEREEKEVEQKEVAREAAQKAHDKALADKYAREAALGSAKSAKHLNRAYHFGGEWPDAGGGSGDYVPEPFGTNAGPSEPFQVPNVEGTGDGSGGSPPEPSIMGETDGKCSKLTGLDCVTTLGCDLDPETNICIAGLPPGMDDQPKGGATLCTPTEKSETKWTGYYVQNGHHDMEFDLSFEKNGTITGSGSDKIGTFTWTGTFKGDNVQAIKNYVGKHTVEYSGLLSQQGSVVEFDGTWKIENCCSDSFHMEEQTKAIQLGCAEDGMTPLMNAGVHPFSEEESCEDDADWVDESGVGCSSLDVNSDYCAAKGTKTYPGFGCSADGSDCKSANEACCMCKIVTNPAAQACSSAPAWQTNNGATCETIDADFCTNFGEDIFPGFGCSEDASDCQSANEACCLCKTGADVNIPKPQVEAATELDMFEQETALYEELLATPKAGRKLLAMPTGPVPMLPAGPRPVAAVLPAGPQPTGYGGVMLATGSAEVGYKCYEHGGNVMPFYTAQGCNAVGSDAQWAGATKDKKYGECLKVAGGSYTWDNRKICPPLVDGKMAPTPAPETPAPAAGSAAPAPAPAPAPVKGEDGEGEGETNAEASIAKAVAQAAEATGSAAKPIIPDPNAPVVPLVEDGGAPPVAEESKFDANSPAPPGFRVVSGDLVPTEEHVEHLLASEAKRIAAAGSAAAAAEEVAALHEAEVKAAEEAAIHAAGSAAILGFKQQRDVAAAQLYKDVFEQGLMEDLNATKAVHDNATAFVDAYPKPHTSPPHNCTDQKEFFLQSCSANQTAELGATLAGLLAKAEKHHKYLADRAAAEAQQWGEALQKANETATELESIEKAAAEDLANHIASQPSMEMAMLQLKDADSCELAKETAYHQCRTTQNAAYAKCTAMWHEAAPLVDLPTGSSAGEQSPKLPVAAGSAMRMSLLEGIVYSKDGKQNSKKTESEKPHTKKPKAKHSKGAATPKLTAASFMKEFMEPIDDIVHNDAEKDIKDIVDRDKNQELWQEADSALSYLGFPALP